MTAYRCYLLGDDGRVNGAQIVECATDATALEKAELRLATSQHSAIEVWDRERRIGSVDLSNDRLEVAAFGGPEP